MITFEKFLRFVTKGTSYKGGEQPPPYRAAQTLVQHETVNSTNLRTNDRMLRAGEAARELDGSDNDWKPYHLAEPSGTVSAARPDVFISTDKASGIGLVGEIGLAAKPEHIRMYSMTILNPALLDGIPSTMVTPIPTLLMSYSSTTSKKSRKNFMEVASILGALK